MFLCSDYTEQTSMRESEVKTFVALVRGRRQIILLFFLRHDIPLFSTASRNQRSVSSQIGQRQG